MKKSLLTFGIVLCSLLIQAQVHVFPPKNIDDSPSSKTIFVYRNADIDILEDLTAVVKSNWHFTENVEMMSIDEFVQAEKNDGDKVFLIDYSFKKEIPVYTDGDHGAGTNLVDFALSFVQKKGDDYQTLAQAKLSITGESISDVCGLRKSSDEIVKDVYTSKDVFSWNLAYIGTVLHTMSDALVEGKEMYTLKNVDDKYTGFLSTAKLYIAEEVESKQNLFNGKETKQDYQEMIDKNYDYDFEIVSRSKVNEMVMNNEEGYLLMFQKVGYGKEIIVLDMAKNEIVYYSSQPRIYFFTKKDIVILNSAVKKGSK